jgi:hypothetical protein
VLTVSGRAPASQSSANPPQPAVDELRLGTLDLSDLMAQFVNPVSTGTSGAVNSTTVTTPADSGVQAANESSIADTSVGNIDTVARDLFPSTPAAAPTDSNTSGSGWSSMEVDPNSAGTQSLNELANILQQPLRQVIDPTGCLHPHVLQLPSSKSVSRYPKF